MKEVDSHEFLLAKCQKESNMEVLLVRMVGGVGTHCVRRMTKELDEGTEAVPGGGR